MSYHKYVTKNIHGAFDVPSSYLLHFIRKRRNVSCLYGLNDVIPNGSESDIFTFPHRHAEYTRLIKINILLLRTLHMHISHTICIYICNCKLSAITQTTTTTTRKKNEKGNFRMASSTRSRNTRARTMNADASTITLLACVESVSYVGVRRVVKCKTHHMCVRV